VLVVVNENSALSRSVGEYYARRRSIPSAQVVRLRSTDDEEIPRAVFDRQIAAPLADFLRRSGWTERILCLATTAGLPIRIAGSDGYGGDQASVDSELAVLYQDLTLKRPHRTAGLLPNPYFRAHAPISHAAYPLYLVTRLAAYSFADVRAMIDRSLEARNRGVAVLDTRGDLDNQGETWFISAAARLPKSRIVLDDSRTVLTGVRDVIAYAGWGSNDKNHTQRDPRFTWLAGAIVTEYVSTNGRTLKEPPAQWTFGSWANPASWFAGTPQSLAADYVRYGASGVSAHVYEPYLSNTPRPNILLPAYLLEGATLAESYWRAIPSISWQNMVLGDPLCRLQ
jgi:uncharacterized protein (TIGR03790 family)